MSSKEISCEDLLILLASMSIAIPKTMKIPHKELNKHLTLAFDTSQQFSTIIASTTPADLTSWLLWPSDKKSLENVSKALTQVMSQHRRGSSSPKVCNGLLSFMIWINIKYASLMMMDSGAFLCGYVYFFKMFLTIWICFLPGSWGIQYQE